MRIAGRALASALQLNPSPHIALSAVAAAATLLRFLQWKRLGASHLEAVWRFYGVFIFAYFFGSVCGLAYCSTVHRQLGFCIWQAASRHFLH